MTHRETQGLQDWITDAKRLFFSKTINAVRKVQAQTRHSKSSRKKYGKENITTICHSLGASEARERSRRQI